MNELENQYEFCTEMDCFWNTDCVCFCEDQDKDPRYGKGCPKYMPD